MKTFSDFVDARLKAFNERMAMWGSQSEIEAMAYILVECEEIVRHEGKAFMPSVSKHVSDALKHHRDKEPGLDVFQLCDREWSDREFLDALMRVVAGARKDLKSW